MRTIIIGAGPAGLNAAIHSKSASNEVIILEKNEKAGKKLFITGKGRCNVTNDCSNEDFIKNIVNNGRFLYSAINNFSSKDTINYFESHHVPLVIERGNRVFPKSYKSYDITDGLVNECKRLGVIFKFYENVSTINKVDDKFLVTTNKNKYEADFLVIATGGLSYPSTGSTGDGYRFAKDFNHTIIATVPALTAIKVNDHIPHELNQFTLKNVSLTAKSSSFKHTEFGEMTFYDNCIDGPIVITTSSLINRIKEHIELELDLKPALTNDKLLERINRDISNNPNQTLEELLKGLMHADFISFFLEKHPFNKKEKCTNFSKEKRLLLVNSLKHFSLSYAGLGGYERAVVTSGGVSVKEINSKNMESKLVKNLYFAGEVIDVDAFTGGFNIQIALSTGALAGDDIKDKLNEIR